MWVSTLENSGKDCDGGRWQKSRYLIRLPLSAAYHSVILCKYWFSEGACLQGHFSRCIWPFEHDVKKQQTTSHSKNILFATACNWRHPTYSTAIPGRNKRRVPLMLMVIPQNTSKKWLHTHKPITLITIHMHPPNAFPKANNNTIMDQ